MRSEVLVRRISRAIVRRQLRTHLAGVEGLHHLPTTGSFVLVPNHRSYFDHFVMELLVGAAVGRPVWFLTKQESFERPLSRVWTKAWYGIPVERDRPSPGTLRAVQAVFAADEVLCVYPEGTRNATDEMLPFQAGAFRFALTAGVPIIPVALTGTESVLPKGSRRFRREGRVRVAFGAPIVPDLAGGKQRAAQRLATETRAAITALLATDWRAADGSAAPRALDDLVTAALDPAGRLAVADERRLRFVLRLMSSSHARSADIEVQHARLRGLAILRRPAPLRALPALVVRRRLERVLRADPEHSLANYLLARWHLAMPAALGGDSTSAEQLFSRSAQATTEGDTRALSGLVELQLGSGRVDAARETLRRIADAPAVVGSRAEARATRARLQLVTLADLADPSPSGVLA